MGFGIARDANIEIVPVSVDGLQQVQCTAEVTRRCVRVAGGDENLIDPGKPQYFTSWVDAAQSS